MKALFGQGQGRAAKNNDFDKKSYQADDMEQMKYGNNAGVNYNGNNARVGNNAGVNYNDGGGVK